MYYIKINQRVLSLIGNREIDIVDGAILCFLIQICSSSSYKLHRLTEKGIQYTWVSYSNLLHQMPMIKINTTSPIQKRINKLIKYGFLLKTLKDKTKSYIAILDKTKLLDKQALPKGFEKICVGCARKCEDCQSFKSLMSYEEPKNTNK